jgi:allophanate hydrolase subunit 1
MFEVTKPSPTALQPGELVKFMPIDLDTYYSMHKNGNGSN